MPSTRLPGLHPGCTQAIAPDLQLIRGDAFPFFVFLLQLAAGNLYLWGNDLDWYIRVVENGVGNCGLVVPLPHITDRCLDLLALPLRPGRRIDADLLFVFLIESGSGYLCHPDGRAGRQVL